MNIFIELLIVFFSLVSAIAVFMAFKLNQNRLKE